MKNIIRIAFAFFPILGFGGCFEVSNPTIAKFEGKFSVCPLENDIKYTIGYVTKSEIKPIGTIKAQNVQGGECTLKDVEVLEAKSARGVMDFIGSRFYDLGDGISFGFNGNASEKPVGPSKYFVFASKGANGNIAIFTNCVDTFPKTPSEPKITCSVFDEKELQTLSKNLKLLEPTLILKPVK